MIDGISFIWDDEKAAANVRKHGVSFEAAIRVFADPAHLTRHDRIEGGEHRWQTIGLVDHVKLLLVAHSWTDEDGVETVRVISARRATPRERRDYDHG